MLFIFLIFLNVIMDACLKLMCSIVRMHLLACLYMKGEPAGCTKYVRSDACNPSGTLIKSCIAATRHLLISSTQLEDRLQS